MIVWFDLALAPSPTLALASAAAPEGGEGPGGALLWQFDPGLDIELAAMPSDPVVAAFIDAYAYMPRDGAPRWILCGDDARFYNHSDQPNTQGDEWISHAAVALAADTELTIDYGSFDRRPLDFWL